MLLHTIEKGKYARIEPDRVVYIESSHNNCMLHMADGKQIAVYSTLTALRDKFPDFLQPLVSYIVNPIHVYSIRHANHRVTVKFSNGDRIEFTKSKKYYPQFFSSL
jgi:DNA-binding LytR/AlgR family response regulator